MLYEIRNYHLKQESLSDYECWAKTHALPLLEEQLDIIGFWRYSRGFVLTSEQNQAINWFLYIIIIYYK